MNTKECLTFAVDVGMTMLTHGGEVYRVQDTILHILNALDITECDVFVLPNAIMASANENREDACSVVRNVELGGIHLGKVSAINQLSRDLTEKKLSFEEAQQEYLRIKNMPTASVWLIIFFTGIGTGCFAYMFGGTVIDGLFAFMNGLVLEYWYLKFLNHRKNRFIKNIFGAAIVTVLALVYLYIGMPIHTDKVIIGSIIPLVPGIALTTSIRDLFYSDYLSGAIHLLDALLTGMCIAVGVGTIMSLYNIVIGGL